MVDDASAALGQIPIERLCGVRTFHETYTDSKGRFSFQMGESQSAVADASVDPVIRAAGGNGGNQNALGAEANLGCELRASLSGFRSDVIPLGDGRHLESENLGTIILHHVLGARGMTTSATSSLAPKEARKSFDRGIEAIRRNNPDEAQKAFLEATGLYTRYAEAWFELGRVYERRYHFPEAEQAYEKSVAADGNYLKPSERLCILALQESRWQAAADLSDRVLHLNPYEFAGDYYYNAIANLKLNRFDAAEKSAREATKLGGPLLNPRSHYILGYLLLQRGDYAGSSEQLRVFLDSGPNSADTEQAQRYLRRASRLLQASAAPPQK